MVVDNAFPSIHEKAHFAQAAAALHELPGVGPGLAYARALKDEVRQAAAVVLFHGIQQFVQIRVPGEINSLLRWVRDYAQVRGDGVITEQLAHDALTMIEIDDDGLDEMDKRLLEAMIYKFNGGPVGLSSLAVAVGEDASTLEDVHEPFLIMQGYISRTPRGRVAMPSAYLKMGAAPPANGQGWLL